MKTIEDIAIQTYHNNIAYLEKNHPSLHQQLTTLDTAIAQGLYQERYSLEYKDESYFDIQELSSSEWLYGVNSIEYSKKLVEIMDLKRSGAIFKAQKYVYATEKQANEIDASQLSFHNSLWATIKITNYVNAYTPPETYMNRVHKIIFLGTGLGIHLLGISEKLQAQVIFIKEKNLEIFRLSLFVTDYSYLAQNRFLYFSITDDEMLERSNFLPFLDKGNNYNLHMKHIPFALNYEPELRRLQGHVLSQSYISYGYSAILLRFIDSPRYLARGYSFLNVGQKHHNNIFCEKPVLLLFSGPSTSKNIDWVIKNRHRFILVTALSTCKLLHNAGIVPDVVIHIDPGERTALLFEGLDVQEYFKDTIVLLASNVDEKTVEKLEHSTIHFIEQGTSYKKDFGKLSAPSVGEYAYGLSLILGAKKIFMLGIDLALDNETLQTHGGFHAFQRTGEIDDKNASLDPTASVEFVRGNFLEQVPTFSAYKLSLSQIEIFTQMLKNDTHTIYNLSNGAYLQGCEPLKIETYDWNNLAPLDSNEIHENLSSFFNTISSHDFNADDKGQLKYQLKEAKKLEKIIKQHQKKKYLNADAYLNSLSKLSWDLSDMDYKTLSDLAQVYYEYFPIVQSYIFDLFNTQGLANLNKHIVEIDKILTTQLLKIAGCYINKMESYLK